MARGSSSPALLPLVRRSGIESRSANRDALARKLTALVRSLSTDPLPYLKALVGAREELEEEIDDDFARSSARCLALLGPYLIFNNDSLLVNAQAVAESFELRQNFAGPNSDIPPPSLTFSKKEVEKIHSSLQLALRELLKSPSFPRDEQKLLTEARVTASEKYEDVVGEVLAKKIFAKTPQEQISMLAGTGSLWDEVMRHYYDYFTQQFKSPLSADTLAEAIAWSIMKREELSLEKKDTHSYYTMAVSAYLFPEALLHLYDLDEMLKRFTSTPETNLLLAASTYLPAA